MHELRTQELRVARVSYRLALANQEFCGQALSPQPGFSLHGIEQYDPADRSRVSAAFGLDQHVGVMTVVPGSAADRAGLKADDRIVTVNARPLRNRTSDANSASTRLLVQRAQDIIHEEMTKGEVTFTVMDARGHREVRFRPAFGCPAAVELLPGNAVNAWADGERVVVGTGLLARCKTDDDLAFVIAHELAHNLLRHSHSTAARSDVSIKVFGLRGSGSATMLQAEEAADRLAVRLVRTAAYDVAGAADFMSGLLKDRAEPGHGKTHPTTDRRLRVIKAEIAGNGAFVR